MGSCHPQANFQSSTSYGRWSWHSRYSPTSLLTQGSTRPRTCTQRSCQRGRECNQRIRESSLAQAPPLKACTCSSQRSFCSARICLQDWIFLLLVSFVVSGGGSVLILCIRVPSHSFSTFLALGYLLSVGFGSVGSVDSSSPFSLRCYAPQTFSVVLAHLAHLLRSRLEDDTLTATLERLDLVLSFLCHYNGQQTDLEPLSPKFWPSGTTLCAYT